MGPRYGVVVALAVALMGCGGPSEPEASVPTSAPSTSSSETTVVAGDPVGGLVATIEVSRLFSLQRQLALGLRNVGDEPVVVRTQQLDSSLFATEPAAEREVLLAPGGRELVMPVPYGSARCEGTSADDTFAALVTTDAGTQLRLEAPEKHAGSIGRLHARECAAEAVHAQADLRLGDSWTREGNAVTGQLLLEQRREGASVTVDGVAGSVIFAATVDEPAPILRVSDDAPTAQVPVVFSAERCDPHALIESKKTFVFLAWVGVDGAEPVPVELHPTGVARAALEGLLAECSAQVAGEEGE